MGYNPKLIWNISVVAALALTSSVNEPLGCIYIRAKAKAKAIFFVDLLQLTHRCGINTQETMQIGNKTDRKQYRFRFRFDINAP